MKSQLSHSYLFPCLLISSVLLGGIFGYWGGKYALLIKPLGELFLNLIFSTIVPLVFFSIASAISKINSGKKYKTLFITMILSFLLTGLVTSIIALCGVKMVNLGQNIDISYSSTAPLAQFSLLNKLVELFSTSSFLQLFSHQHMMALIVFSLLVGIASAGDDDKSQKFSAMLQAGETIFMRVFNLVMIYAPIGFFAYFAALVHDIGPKVFRNYLEVTVVYYVIATLVFIVLYSFYAYLAGQKSTVKLFWKHIWLPATTALATCSSAATIPSNLAATKAMKLPPEVCDTVIPLGTMINKQGSIIGGMIKIAFLFGVLHIDFSGPSVLLTAIGVSLLVGTVMGAIPSGGMLGELLILSVYGLPASMLLIISAISIIIDPMATLLNATGNTVNCLLISKIFERRFKENFTAELG